MEYNSELTKENQTVETRTQKIGFLQDGNGNFSSGRLIKVAAFIIASIITVLIITPIIVAYFMSLFYPNKIIPDIPSNIIGLIQTILWGFLSLALGSEAIQKFTNH